MDVTIDLNGARLSHPRERQLTDKKRHSLPSTLALWAGSIVLICIAGAVSIFGGLALVLRFFGGH